MKVSARDRATGRLLPGAAYVSLILLLAASVAALLNLSSPRTVLLFAGLAMSVVMVFMPMRAIVWLMAILCIVGVGMLQYFGRVNQALWLPAIFGLLLCGRALAESAWRRGISGTNGAEGARPFPAFGWPLLGFFAAFGLSAIANQVPFPQAIAGLKNYVFLWGFAFALIAVPLRPIDLENLWWGFLWIAAMQLPMAIYQHFFVSTGRTAVGVHNAAWDSVVGTLGGDPEGGGASGALALILTLGMLLGIALWRRRLLSSGSMCLTLAACGVTIALAEIKVIFVLVPAAFLLLHRRELLRRPVFLTVAATTIVAGSVLLIQVYDQMYWRSSSGTLGAMDHLERSFVNLLDPDNVTRATGEVGRVAGLVIWAEDSQTNPFSVLLGYGPGASRLSKFAAGEIALRYFPFQIGSTSAATLLWDVGVVGALLYVLVAVTASVQALRLARGVEIPEFHRCALEVTGVMLFLILSLLPYNSDVLYLPATGFLLVFLVGYAGYWERYARDVRRVLGSSE